MMYIKKHHAAGLPPAQNETLKRDMAFENLIYETWYRDSFNKQKPDTDFHIQQLSVQSHSSRLT